MSHRLVRCWQRLSHAERAQRLADLRQRQQPQISMEIRRLSRHV